MEAGCFWIQNAEVFSTCTDRSGVKDSRMPICHDFRVAGSHCDFFPFARVPHRSQSAQKLTSHCLLLSHGNSSALEAGFGWLHFRQSNLHYVIENLAFMAERNFDAKYRRTAKANVESSPRWVWLQIENPRVHLHLCMTCVLHTVCVWEREKESRCLYLSRCDGAFPSAAPSGLISFISWDIHKL